ncbi:MAG: mannose-1-phosphate guanylyltransferase [Crocinitomicaceae bacterium]|nr:mannose-1-phosphate guanylyltransferase [Crocinitomicaceae bacterium]
MDKNNYSIIMAGGIGSRFWPMSKPSYPKQFLDVLGMGKSLIQMTFERLCMFTPKENIYVVTNKAYRELVLEQLPLITSDQVLCEPERKNTAPCIAYAANKIYDLNPDARMVVAPSDHLILNEGKFKHIIEVALDQSVKEDCLVTLGIKPSRPDTGYGYIQFHQDGDMIAGQVKKVKQFTEKPNLELAKIFLTSGDYYWNSGIFIWSAKSVLNALNKFKPELNALFSCEAGKYNSDQEQEFVDAAFHNCEDVSIDYAIMENAKNVYVVLANFDWSDLGTWGSLYTHLEKDYHGNAVIGNHVHMFDSNNCIVNMPKDKLCVIQGMNEHIVVESDGMLMIFKKKDEQLLKEYLKKAEKMSPEFFKK